MEVAFPLLARSGNAAAVLDRHHQLGLVKVSTQELVRAALKPPESDSSKQRQEWMVCSFSKTGKSPQSGYYRVCFTCTENRQRDLGNSYGGQQPEHEICLICSAVRSCAGVSTNTWALLLAHVS